MTPLESSSARPNPSDPSLLGENVTAFVRPEAPTMADAESFSDRAATSEPTEVSARAPQSPRRRKSDHPAFFQTLPQSLDGLREHPVFTFEEPETTGSIPREALCEAQREPLFGAELLRMFCQRIRLVAVLGMVLMPLFAAFYFFLAPMTASQTTSAHVLMMAALVVIWILTGLLQSLRWTRTLSLAGYAIYCMGSAAIIAIVTQGAAMDDTGTRAIQFVVLASYVHILLSILLLPYSLWESWVAVVVISCSFGWGMSWTASTHEREILFSQLFVLVTTAFMILCISHLQNLLRRKVFDSAFDLALTASRMQEMSATDPLTGGFNRRHIERLLPGELTRAARFGHYLSLIMFDLDNFKPVNDTLGHPAGDEVLREIWEAGVGELREVDTMARFGGDEFLILLPETDADSARAIAERLKIGARQRLRQRFGAQSLEGGVTLSMGVLTLHQNQSANVEDTLSRVDELLYSAKRAGKDRIAAS